MSKETRKAQGLKRGFSFPKVKAPLALTLVVAASALAFAAALLHRDMAFRLAFGDALAIEAAFLLGSAWFGYLKKDGVHFLPTKGQLRSSESWKERVPSLGGAPSVPQPIPGEKGPNDPEYRRLALAEEELRKKIAGDGLNDAPGKTNTRSSGFVNGAFFSGLVLMLAALCLEYLL